MRTAWLFVLLGLLAQPVASQSFTCRFGTRPSCLEFNDTVCPGGARCVAANAVCFDQFQCNFRGFACRSDLDHCAAEYEALLRNHNRLVDDFNTLLQDSRELRSALTESEYCILRATSLEEAQRCF